MRNESATQYGQNNYFYFPKQTAWYVARSSASIQQRLAYKLLHVGVIFRFDLRLVTIERGILRTMIKTSAEREALLNARSPWQQAITPTVFVVDDDQDIRDVITQTLDDEGYHVVPFSDGEEALEAIYRAQPRLVLLDLMMPKVSGWDVLQQLRAQSRTVALPVVLISASRELIRTCDELGASACLAKPFDLDRLVAVVQTYAGAPTQ